MQIVENFAKVDNFFGDQTFHYCESLLKGDAKKIGACQEMT